MLRTGKQGDLFGLRRGGLSPKRLREAPHGIVLAEDLEEGVLERKIRHRDGRVRLFPPEIAAEVEALRVRGGEEDPFPLRMIGLRELRSHNSWMHNSPKLMAGDRVHRARINPTDAEAAGIADGDRVAVASARGRIETEALVTDEVVAGTIAVPHGWGHDGGWQRANRAGGPNVNVLASSEPEDLERLAGMAHLNGIPVRIERVGAATARAAEGTAGAAAVPTGAAAAPSA
jgi:formate dehydrogenase